MDPDVIDIIEEYVSDNGIDSEYTRLLDETWADGESILNDLWEDHVDDLFDALYDEGCDPNYEDVERTFKRSLR